MRADSRHLASSPVPEPPSRGLLTWISELVRSSAYQQRMPRRIAIVQGHPDPAGHHLLHAMADAYAEAAMAAGHETRRIDVANLEFPLLRTQNDFEKGTVPAALVGPQDDMRWAERR